MAKDKKSKKKPPKALERNRGIVEIFKEGGEKVDMTRLEPVKKSRRKILWVSVIVLVILMAATLLGFFLFTRDRGKFGGNNIEFTISAPDSMASGDEILILLNYRNKEAVALKNVIVSARYPEGFHFSEAIPRVSNEFNNNWELDTIASGSSGQVKIIGKLVGEVGTAKSFVFSMNFSPANFSSNFSQEASHLVDLTSSVLDIEIEAPAKAIGSQEISYKIKYTNSSQSDLENFRLLAFYPEDFELLSTDPEPKRDNNLWQVDKLASDESGEITVSGRLTGNPGDLKELKIQMLLRDENNNYNPQLEKTHLVLIVNTSLELTLKINDSSESTPVNLGDTLNYKIGYKNTGEIEIKDLTLEASLEGVLLDFSSLDDSNNGQVSDGKIIWSKDQIEGFDRLIPSEEGNFNFSIKLVPSLLIDSEDDKNFEVKSKVTATSNTLGDLKGAGFRMDSNEIINKLNSKFGLQSEGRYFSEEFEQLGSGPLPPMVGETTTYRIYWYLSNTTNTVSDVEVKTTLPNTVFWTGRSNVSAGKNISFKNSSREVVWEINQIPPQAGFISSSLVAWFEVSITPSRGDIGKTLTLTRATQAKATDSFSGSSLSVSDDKITTNLENDVGARDKGRVVATPNNNIDSNLNDQ